MVKISRHFVAVIVLFLTLIFNCCESRTDIYGSWESIKIESDSNFFKNTLPSEKRGEIQLNFSSDGRFRWINTSEETDLSGNFTTEADKIRLKIDNSDESLQVLFLVRGDRLIISTDDGFTYTFVKNSQK